MGNKIFLYHITDFSNLESIIQYGGLMSSIMVNNNHVSYINIAHNNIQDRRLRKEVLLSPYGVLRDYVLFYFAPRSPMLYAIYKNQVEGYEKGQEQIIYVITRTDIINNAGLEYVFSDGHAIMNFTSFYKDLDDLDKIDWEVMESKYWADTEEDPDRKRRRQAEFLVYKFVPFRFILGFAVKNEVMMKKVEAILKKYNIEKPVVIRNTWYF